MRILGGILGLDRERGRGLDRGRSKSGRVGEWEGRFCKIRIVLVFFFRVVWGFSGKSVGGRWMCSILFLEGD